MRSNPGNSSWVAGCLAIGLFLIPAVAYSQSKSGKVSSPSVLTKVVDIPMPGPAVRFDYQSLDAESGRLYISHMNADQMVVFDTAKRKVDVNLDGFKRVHGVWAVPELSRVYASVTGEHWSVLLSTTATAFGQTRIEGPGVRSPPAVVRASSSRTWVKIFELSDS